MTWPVRLLVFAVAMGFSAINGIETGEGPIDLIAGFAILAAFLWPRPNKHRVHVPQEPRVDTRASESQSRFDHLFELCETIDPDIPDEDMEHLCFAGVWMGDTSYPMMKALVDGYRSAFGIGRFHNLDRDVPFSEVEQDAQIARAVELGFGAPEAASVMATLQAAQSLGLYLPDDEVTRLGDVREASVSRLLLDAGSAGRSELERRFNMGVGVGIAALGEQLPT